MASAVKADTKRSRDEVPNLSVQTLTTTYEESRGPLLNDTQAFLQSMQDNFARLLESDPIPDKGEDARFLKALFDGRVLAVRIEADALQGWYQEGKLLFREPSIFGPDAAKVELPLDPVKCGINPIIFIEIGDGRFLVMNGNHRTYRILTQTGDDNHPLYFMKLSKDTFEEIFSYNLKKVALPDGTKDWGVTTPEYLAYSPRESRSGR